MSTYIYLFTLVWSFLDDLARLFFHIVKPCFAFYSDDVVCKQTCCITCPCCSLTGQTLGRYGQLKPSSFMVYYHSSSSESSELSQWLCHDVSTITMCCMLLLLTWFAGGVVRVSGLAVNESGGQKFNSSPLHCQLTSLGKFVDWTQSTAFVTQAL